MTALCPALTQNITTNLANGFEAHPVDGGCVIVTPFLYPDSAHIEIYVEEKNGRLLLTDEGETLANLFVMGLNLKDNSSLAQKVERIARLNGVRFADSTLFVEVAKDNAGEASRQLLNAIQATAYLIYTRSHRRRSTFNDQIEEFLLANRVKYERNFKAQGASASHRIPYYINSNRNVFLEPVSARTPNSARNVARRLGFQWADLERGNTSGRFTVVVDDREERWEKVWSDNEALKIVRDYSDEVIRWEAERPRLFSLLVE